MSTPKQRVTIADVRVAVARLEEGQTNLRDVLTDHTEADAANFADLKGDIRALHAVVAKLQTSEELAQIAGAGTGRRAGSAWGAGAGGFAAALVWVLGKLVGIL